MSYVACSSCSVMIHVWPIDVEVFEKRVASGTETFLCTACYLKKRESEETKPMDFQALLKEHHPDLYRSQFTEQYRLSEIILDYLFTYKLKQQQMADMMDLPFGEYLNLEFGFDSVPVEKYQQVIRLFELRVGIE